MHISFQPNADLSPAILTEPAGVPCFFSDNYVSEGDRPIFHDQDLLFDGFRQWITGPAPAGGMQFTFSIAFFPLTFSAHGDGLFCAYDPENNQGLALTLEKGGKLTVTLGIGPEPFRFSSIKAHAPAGCFHVATVVFRGDVGWCDLYVDGIFSSRKQFGRQTRLTFPTKMYIGKLVIGKQFREELPFGSFFGFLRWADVQEVAASEKEILALHATVATGIRDEELFHLGMPRRKMFLSDPNHPTYHLSAPGKWMNEPHGPVFYKGWYHIFYQANPHAPIWDHLCWGHLRSRDMVRWESCPLALIPEKEGPAPDGCWSGSSVIDKNGIPRIYYTAGDDKRFPNQAVAVAFPEDDDLFYWHSEEQLVQEQSSGWMGEFRDPFVWLENDTYYMLVGSGDALGGGGNAILYSSYDGFCWHEEGFLVDYDFKANQEVGHVWELPVLLPLKDETGKIVCHILLFCACRIEGVQVENYYFLGNWDPKARVFHKLHEKAGLMDLGWGTFTGPSGFVTPDGRSVVFTIAQGMRPFPEECKAGWAHNGGLPVELYLEKGELHFHPVHEIETLRGDRYPISSAEDLKKVHSDQLYLSYTTGAEKASVSLFYGEKELKVTYDKASGRLTTENEAGQEIGFFRRDQDLVFIGEENIHFSCYLDHSMLEIYLNDKKSVTLRNYTEGKRHFEISAPPTRLDLWEMNTGFGA